jgi:hypothetical protein
MTGASRTLDESALRAALERDGGELTTGLTDTEFDAAETRFGFSFAPDHRLMLSSALPVGSDWPTWRDLDSPDL